MKFHGPRHRGPDANALAAAHRLARARLLDLEADAELQHGHATRAEFLAHQAADLRVVGGDRDGRRVGGAR